MNQLCTEPDCKEEAAFTYVWPWGDTGACCPAHAVAIRQKATQQLNIETMPMSPIQYNQAPPITRDERIAHKASVMVRDEEIEALKTQIGILNQNSREIAADAQAKHGEALRLRSDNLELATKLDQVIRERDAALANAGELQKENTRLSLIINGAVK